MNAKPKINKAAKTPPKYFYLIMFLLPVLFIIVLEMGLRIANYGRNLNAFIKLSEEYENLLFTNPDLPFRYAANMETPPAVSLDSFLKVKPDSTFRIFVMGGSSAAGFPYAYNATFPKYIKRKLEILYPKINFEVINLGITAHNSYTISDLANDVLDQNPDLVLVYAGHNEYYGILGVGSTIKFGGSPWFTNVIIAANKLKITQLLNNIINTIQNSLSKEKKNQGSTETLMARMIGENNIEFESAMYYKGIEQFEYNMENFLEKMRNNNIDVILGSLTSNISQPPFTYLIGKYKTKEDSLFNLGKTLLDSQKFESANTILHEAKEYDPIRFRAPKLINNTITNLSIEYNYPVVNIDSAFSKNSPNGIVGYNLMVDHLHPNIKGYNLIGDLFVEKILNGHYLKKFTRTILTDNQISAKLKSRFSYTKLDSLISYLRIQSLMNSYPFVAKSKSKILNFTPINYLDTMAIRVVKKSVSWRSAHQEVAQWYYKQKMYKNFMAEMNAVIENQPYVEIAYAYTISRLINANRLADAEPYLLKFHKLNPNEYTYKWIGSIALSRGDNKKAVSNLLKSATLNPSDPQVFYNLSGAYFNLGKLSEAKIYIDKCLVLNNRYPSAIKFKQGLVKLIKTKKNNKF